MKNYFNYFIIVLVVIMVSRFFGRILLLFGRFWFIVIPLILILYYMNKKRSQNRKFKRTTGLDPKDEVQLKKEPKVEEVNVEDETEAKSE